MCKQPLFGGVFNASAKRTTALVVEHLSLPLLSQAFGARGCAVAVPAASDSCGYPKSASRELVRLLPSQGDPQVPQAEGLAQQEVAVREATVVGGCGALMAVCRVEVAGGYSKRQ